MTKTCLLIADQFEPTCDLLIAELRRRDVPCVRWNLDKFPSESSVTYSAFGGHFATEVTTDGRKLNLDTVGSIWCRGFRPSGFASSLGGTDRKFAESEAQRALDGLLTIAGVAWINHPLYHTRANSKPAQLFTAREVGLDIPRTVITNDPEEVRAFVAGLGERAIYKTMSQTLVVGSGKAVFTGVLTEKELARLDLIRMSPGVFQELVPKAYEVRVTVVGSRVFSGRINSQNQEETRIDWRRRPFDIESEPLQLPPDVEAKILVFMRKFGLVYGALDFIVTPGGRHVFLEVNPAGQYIWVETATGLAITSALADALSGPCEA